VWFVEAGSGLWKPSGRGVQFDEKRLEAVISGLQAAGRSTSLKLPACASARQSSLGGDMAHMLKKLEAFARRGVKLYNESWSWGGVRGDGVLVLQVWEDQYHKDDSGRRYFQVGYGGPADPGTEDERSKPGNIEREAHLDAIRSGVASGVELLVAHAVDRARGRPRGSTAIAS
jgi:hypothetical protein